MPVVPEKGAWGRSPALLNRTRSEAIQIGIINNMPDSALESTERQFIELLAAVSGETQVRVSLFSLPQITRGDLVWHRCSQSTPISTASRTRDSTASSSQEWSQDPVLCGTSHTGTHLLTSSIGQSGTRRLHFGHVSPPMRSPCTVTASPGVRSQQNASASTSALKQTDHLLPAGAPALARSPHSRWNEVPEDALVGAGYTILTRSPEIGVDMFVKHVRSLFVLLQAHPEYDSATLLREYRRDVGRFLRREREDYPALPRHYLDGPSERSLQAFRSRGRSMRDPKLLESISVDAIAERITNSWQASATRLYRNWLAYLSERRERSLLLTTPVPMRSDL
jgi:homoserine O-succinyltransferase